MALTKETLKNLVDVMQKVSLAIAAVSVGLFSNVVLSHRSIEKEAEPELGELLKVQKDLSIYTATSIINEALPVNHVPYLQFLALTLPHNPDFSSDIAIVIPTVFFSAMKTGSGVDTTSFGSIETLEQMRKAWNTIASTRNYFELGKPDGAYLAINDLGTTSVGFTRATHNLGPSLPAMIGDTMFIRNDMSHQTSISLLYDFSPALSSLSDANISTLMHALKLAENKRDLLKNTQLVVQLPATPREFASLPALKFGSLLGITRDFGAAFPNLEKLTGKYQNENLRSLRTLLEETVAQQPKGELEVFGAKIPSELIALLGLPVLATLLFQFSAVGFYAASRIERLEEEEASEWSFLLSGLPFLILSFGMIFILPAAASIVTFLFVPTETPFAWLTKPALATLVLVCAAIAFFALQKLRLRVLRNPGVNQRRRSS